MSVLIEFVGLIMITTNTTPVRALIPKVPMPDKEIVQTTSITMHHSMQDHTALIAFPKAAFNQALSNWNTRPLGVSNDYLEVLLNRDTVVFDTDDQTSVVSSAKALGLPTLKHSAETKLTTYFSPPLFEGTAGVVEIPKGTLSACHGKADRIDALLSLNASKQLVIRSLNTNRQIVLDASQLEGQRLYVVNAPAKYPNTGDVSGSFTDHWHVYYWMTTSPDGSAQPSADQMPPDCDSMDPLLRKIKVDPGPKKNLAPADATPLTGAPSKAGTAVGAAPTRIRSTATPAPAPFAYARMTTTTTQAPAQASVTPDPLITSAECGSTQWP